MTKIKSVLALAAVLAVSSVAMATSTDVNTIRVTGEAEVQVKPNLAVVTLTVTTKSTSSKKALAENADKSKALLDLIKSKFGIQETDYKNAISQSEENKYSDDNRKVIAVEKVARNTFQFKIRNLDEVGNVIDLASSAGGETSYVTYGLEDSKPYQLQVLKMAGAAATAKAQALLSAFPGRDLGGILEVSESSTSANPYRAVPSAARMDAPPSGGSAPSAVNGGMITVSASAIFTFRISGF